MNCLDDVPLETVRSMVLKGLAPTQISKKTRVGLEKVLLVGFDLHNPGEIQSPEARHQLYEDLVNYILECNNLKVPKERVVGVLRDNFGSLFEMQDYSKDRFNGSGTVPEIPLQMPPAETIQVSYGSQDAHRITTYGAICENYGKFGVLLDSWKKNFAPRFKSGSPANQDEIQATTSLYHIAAELRQDIASFRGACPRELLTSLREHLEEMDDPVNDFLDIASARLPKR